MASNNRKSAHRFQPLLAADEATVRELLSKLTKAWEDMLNAYRDEHDQKPVSYMDGMMAAHNFHRLVIQHIVEESKMPTVEGLAFMRMATDTFIMGMERDRGQLSSRAKGVQGPDGG